MLEGFIKFLRLKVSLLAAAVGTTGYLIFNPLGFNLAVVAFSSFFLGSVVYSFNLITDKEEDLANKGRINRFAENDKALLVIGLFALIGLLLAFYLGLNVVFVYVFSMIIGISYSLFRLKKHLFVKNLCTGFSFGLLFIMGAIVNPPISFTMIFYYFLLSLIFFSISVIADIRDTEGDHKAGIITISTHFGIDNAKKLIYACLFIPSAFILLLELSIFFALLPFTVCCLLLLKNNKVNLAHHYQMMAFLCLPIILLINSI